MLTIHNPRAGDRYTIFDFSWVWHAPGVERGHWEADDHTGITIWPASDGITDIQVCVPLGSRAGKEKVLHLDAEATEQAFRYAADERRTRGH